MGFPGMMGMDVGAMLANAGPLEVPALSVACAACKVTALEGTDDAQLPRAVTVAIGTPVCKRHGLQMIDAHMRGWDEAVQAVHAPADPDEHDARVRAELGGADADR